MPSPKPRFPSYLVDAASRKRLPEGDHPRDLAIARGENAANAWVLACFNKAAPPPPANERCMEFGVESPKLRSKPTKLEFVQAMADYMGALEAKFGFDSGNGTAQLKGKDTRTCEAYGFFDRLDMLAQRFDLWDFLHKARKS